MGRCDLWYRYSLEHACHERKLTRRVSVNGQLGKGSIDKMSTANCYSIVPQPVSFFGRYHMVEICQCRDPQGLGVVWRSIRRCQVDEVGSGPFGPCFPLAQKIGRCIIYGTVGWKECGGSPYATLELAAWPWRHAILSMGGSF